jgi:hypothetical protein
LLCHEGAVGGLSTLDLKATHKWVGHHTFTQNFKALTLWVISFIKYSTSTFPSNVRPNSPHTCHNNLHRKCKSFNSFCFPSSRSFIFSSIHQHRR